MVLLYVLYLVFLYSDFAIPSLALFIVCPILSTYRSNCTQSLLLFFDSRAPYFGLSTKRPDLSSACHTMRSRTLLICAAKNGKENPKIDT